ncbi:MAG: methionyl aminopeptidase [Candidatus Saganbacteria bacterium]|uniref:Methionine aminopeptidase n=1 Tax=Candidatus Saganbacteria bacterium TaxID=2575572 RepID=A0A833NYK4_UNCSA|nr:MAG: methionyl aminopeptidase [Candidatus Saganbacteria bacterium]
MISIKTPEEIDRIRKASKIVALALRDIEKYLKPGISTLEIDGIIEKLIVNNGGFPAFKGYRGYRHAACISVNHEVVHGIPSDEKKLSEGDVVAVDVGAVWEGYYGDSAKTFAIGRIPKIAKKLLKCGEDALDDAIKIIKPGVRLGDVSSAIESRANRNGFSVVKDLFGHGIGKNLHEDPLIPNFGNKGEGIELKEGMVLAIEPMINEGGYKVATLSDGWTVITVDKKLSVHFEHTVLVAQNGVEILTCLKKM